MRYMVIYWPEHCSRPKNIIIEVEPDVVTRWVQEKPHPLEVALKEVQDNYGVILFWKELPE